ncbi:MAG: glycosyltransferase [Steroidobacteraceae bacterium]
MTKTETGVDPLAQNALAPLIAEGLYSFEIGGGERVGANLALAFVRRGYRVTVFAMYGEHGPIRDELEEQDIRCVGLNYLAGSRWSRRLTYPFRIAAFLRRERAVALHVHYGTALIVIAWGAMLARVSRTVMTEHALHQYLESPKYMRQIRIAAVFAQFVTGVNSSIVEFFRTRVGVAPDRAVFIPNGVQVPLNQLQRNMQMRRDLEVHDDDFLFVFVGRLHPTKDIPTLLRAFAQVRLQPDSNARLWIVGDGAERAALEVLAERLLVSARVTFLGQRTDVRQILCAADTLVMSSITEGAPMVLLEAMAQRVPCIATSVGAIPELLLPDCGLVVGPRSPDELAAAMTRMLSDGALRDSVRHRAFTRVATNYDIEKTVDQYLNLLGLPARWMPET